MSEPEKEPVKEAPQPEEKQEIPPDTPVNFGMMERHLAAVLFVMKKTIKEEINASERRIGQQVEATLAPWQKQVNSLTELINNSVSPQQEQGGQPQQQQQPAAQGGRPQLNLPELLQEIREIVSVAKETGIIKGDEQASNLDTLSLITRKRIDQRLSKVVELEAKKILKSLNDDDPFKEEIQGALTDKVSGGGSSHEPIL